MLCLTETRKVTRQCMSVFVSDQLATIYFQIHISYHGYLVRLVLTNNKLHPNVANSADQVLSTG